MTARTVITAADESYYRTLCQFFLSVERVGESRSSRWIVSDLGMSDGARNHLARRFPWCAVEPFAFEQFGPHLRRLFSCAWKPVVIEGALQRYGGRVLWLDSATLLRCPLDQVFERIERDGAFTLLCQSPLARWCHPSTLEVMQVPADDLVKRCRFGGALGFDGTRPEIRELVARWRDFALMPGCIDPPGARRENHRYDQSIVTNLLYAWQRERGLVLGNEEVDISSYRPVRWFSTRNKVAPWVPLALDPMVRAWFAVYKAVDRGFLRARHGRG